MKIIHYIPSIDRASGGVGAYMQLLTEELGKLVELHVVTHKEGNRKWELFRQADLFILPTHSENFGIVVAEALACGTPVVTTKGTPWKELEEYRCGWWTNIGTEPTTKALKSFLQCSDTQLEEMGRNGRRLIEEKYSSVAVARQFVEMYDELIHDAYPTFKS